MYKVGIMMMGKQSVESPTKVKQVILEVEAKTKISNIFEYLLELKKINNMNVSVALQKSGTRINETSTISQVLKYTRPVNGVIKLYLYNQEENHNTTTEKLVLKPSRHELANPQQYTQVQKQAQRQKVKKQEEERKRNKKETDQGDAKSNGFCCC